MIDKITPRGLDKSSDHKLVSRTSMIDALNLYIADDYLGPEGNAGVLKSVRGNVVVDYATDNDRPVNELAHIKVIGSTTDEKTKIVYLYVWSQYLEDHGVWAYDPYGKLPISKTQPQGIPNTIRKILCPGAPFGGFEFDENGFVKGDVIYTNTNEFEKHPAIRDFLSGQSGTSSSIDYESLRIDFEKDALLYFTDNKNEPRRLNVYRALLETSDPNSSFNNYNLFDRQDLICACPKVPLDRISFTWDTDSTVSTNNFATTPGFQFAYQAIYKDKIESAISTYSKIAFPPTVVHRGSAAANMILQSNVCILSVPQLGPEVESVRLLARYGNTSNFFEIDEVPNLELEDSNNWTAQDRTYIFRNDRVGFGVSPNEVDKTFDKVPRKAQAQTTISNRLVYGNYLEGFDNVKTICDSSVIYKERPRDYRDYVVRFRPSVFRTPFGNNKCVGFEIDTRSFDSRIFEGTEVSVVVNYRPDRNFHMYQADGSYHQSRQAGWESKNAFGYKRWPFKVENTQFSVLNNSFSGNPDGQSLSNGHVFEGSPAEEMEHRHDENVQETYDRVFPSTEFPDPSVNYLDRWGNRFFGMNYGVGSKGQPAFIGMEGADALNYESNLPYWKQYIYDSDMDAHGGGYHQTRRARYGTSAGNPLILQGGDLEFKVRFVVTNDELWNGKKLIAETVMEALCGATGDDLSWSNYVNLLEVQNLATLNIDLGLDSFDRIQPGDPFSYLICGVGQSNQDDNTITEVGKRYLVGDGDHGSQSIPMGYFIVNKAEVEFYMELVQGDELSYSDASWWGDGSSTAGRVRLCISKITPDQDNGLLTCVKKIDPRSPWWVFKKSNLLGGTVPTQDSETYHISDPVFLQEDEVDDWSFLGQFSSVFTDPLDEGIGNPDIAVNRACWGFLDISNSFFTFYENIMNPPELGVSRFKFSLMDGEGGPGGALAGGGSAYDLYGNADYGSIAARVDLGWDATHSQLARKEIVGAANSAQFSYQSFDGGKSDGGDYFGGPYRVADGDIIEEWGLGTTDYPKIKYHVSGPFFTGTIAMNPIDKNEMYFDANHSNPQPFPDVKDYSTTMPLIWMNSRGIPIHELSENGSDYDGGEFPTNWCQSPYPWPQTIASLPEGFDTYDDDGVANLPVDPLPFREAYSADGAWVGESESPPAQDFFGSVDFSQLHSHIELTGASSYVGGNQEFRSFKTSAMHEFGVVYYDERGRHGAVNHLDSVYVAGYSNQERGSASQGPVSIQLTLGHQAPEWATNYKIVYSKNTTVNRFVQYSAAGAYVTAGEGASSSPSRIYVSLNHLQGRGISYTNAWGASDENLELTGGGIPLMYTFTKGDRLRIISYMLQPTTDSQFDCPPRMYPQSFEFEVADMVSLGEENNPLVDSSLGTDDPGFNAKQGLFLVLKNNNSCAGFRHQDIKGESHHWGDNCVFELYTPSKELDSDDRLYYEVGESYSVQGGVHVPSTVTIDEGDVYFRRAAVNMMEYDTDGLDGISGYQPLIMNLTDPDDVTGIIRVPESNFKSYYIESPVASDLFRSDSISIGRPNAIDHDAQEAYKEASVIHSDRDVTDAGKVSYSSFNSSLAIDKDLDLKSGGVNYLVNHDDSMFFVQKDKCGHIPIDRTLISDVMGEESLIASSNFLGTPRYYVGRAGADNNPESVVNINN
jgi:hypothetical protein